MYTVNCSYTGLGYTGIRTYRTENFSPQKQLTVCFVRSLLFGYTGFFIYQTLNLCPNQSGIRAIDCNLKFQRYVSFRRWHCLLALLFCRIMHNITLKVSHSAGKGLNMFENRFSFPESCIVLLD